MTLIVNLSTTHDYSIDKTVAAFVQICNQYSKGYRYGAFKTEAVSTVGLLEDLSRNCSSPITLVSQYPGDLKKGEQLDLDNVLNAEDFYMPNSLLKKCQ